MRQGHAAALVELLVEAAQLQELPLGGQALQVAPQLLALAGIGRRLVDQRAKHGDPLVGCDIDIVLGADWPSDARPSAGLKRSQLALQLGNLTLECFWIVAH
jgi:hypothetical protein